MCQELSLYFIGTISGTEGLVFMGRGRDLSSSQGLGLERSSGEGPGRGVARPSPALPLYPLVLTQVCSLLEAYFSRLYNVGSHFAV